MTKRKLSVVAADSEAAAPPIKLCVDCKHIRYRTLGGGKFSKCSYRTDAEEMSPVTGSPDDRPDDDYCILARSESWGRMGYCGPDAKNFEPSGGRARRRWWQLITT
jgi:hypothetical protein